MRAVVTGARGMLGHALVPALASAGWDVFPLDKLDADVTRRDQLRRVFAEARPDWVFHLAAFTRVNECEHREEYARLVNGHGAGNAASAAAEVGAAVLFVSSDYVFDGRASEPYREDHPTAPLNAYGRSKAEGEKATRAMNPRHLIVRTAWLFGHGGRNFPDLILEKARRGEKLSVVNDQTGSPTWTRALAPALVRLVATGQLGTFHCTCSGQCNWFQLAVHLVEREGLDVPVQAIASESLGPPTRPAFSVLDNRRYEEATGDRMPCWKESIDAYLDSRSADHAIGEGT
ncbi:MAG TPA: dTDP-4-dehydrorhamnose reductase [Candidatus Eisenbacteria bacterium]|nr:dTDP-4-dehydrorhamnose reductase [Candidatus Eisenbacteria bacterium]